MLLSWFAVSGVVRCLSVCICCLLELVVVRSVLSWLSCVAVRSRLLVVMVC